MFGTQSSTPNQAREGKRDPSECGWKFSCSDKAYDIRSKSRRSDCSEVSGLGLLSPGTKNWEGVAVQGASRFPEENFIRPRLCASGLASSLQ